MKHMTGNGPTSIFGVPTRTPFFRAPRVLFSLPLYFFPKNFSLVILFPPHTSQAIGRISRALQVLSLPEQIQLLRCNGLLAQVSLFVEVTISLISLDFIPISISSVSLDIPRVPGVFAIPTASESGLNSRPGFRSRIRRTCSSAQTPKRTQE